MTISDITDVINKLHKDMKKFDKEKLEEIFLRTSPQVSLAMLSWLRLPKLSISLNYWTRNHDLNRLNIALMVQEGAKLDQKTKHSIVEKCSKFNKHIVEFTDKNRGTGGPRHSMVHKALSFDTPYIMTTDDDMLFPTGLLEAQIYILETYPDVGAVCSWAVPNAAG